MCWVVEVIVDNNIWIGWIGDSGFAYISLYEFRKTIFCFNFLARKKVPSSV